MLDNMKMSAENFILGLKHGVYVFVSDSCDYCKTYAESLKYVENCHLHVVECLTESDKSAIYQITGKSALPITAAWIDNEPQWTALGQLFFEEEDSDEPDENEWTLNKVAKYLKETFGDKPLTNAEIVEKLAKVKKHCYPAYYIFPPNTPAEIKQAALEKAFEYNELPYDVDVIDNLKCITEKDKDIMLKSNVTLFKLVIFDITKTRVYSDLANSLISEYINRRRTTAGFEMRDL